MILFRLICRLFLKKPAVIHFLIKLRMRKAAGAIFYAAFDRWAPLKERLAASDKSKRRKWNKLGACEYLLEYKPMAAAAILNQLHSHPEQGDNAWIVLNIWLSQPHFVDKQDPIGEIGEIIAESNPNLTEDFMRNGFAQAAVNFLDIVDVPPVSGVLLRLPQSHTAYLLYQLRLKNRQRYEALFHKLNADYASFVKQENFKRTKENLLDTLSDMNEENLRRKLDELLRISGTAQARPGGAGAGSVRLAKKEPS